MMIRVKDKSTGHKLSIAERSFDPDAFEKLNEPAVDAGGMVIPPEHNPNVGGKSTSSKKGSDS